MAAASAISSGVSRQLPACALAASCPGLLTPAMTEAMTGCEASQAMASSAMASSAMVWPRSAAQPSRAGDGGGVALDHVPGLVRGRWRPKRMSSGIGRPARYLPLSNPAASEVGKQRDAQTAEPGDQIGGCFLAEQAVA